MEPLGVADGNVKWWNHFGMQFGINSESLAVSHSIPRYKPKRIEQVSAQKLVHRYS